MTMKTIETPKCVHMFKPNPEADLRVFCFHHAGGHANVFCHWHQSLPTTLDIVGVQLPGRMELSSIAPFADLPPLVNYLYHNLLPYLTAKPFVFLGHSLGGLICFELARLLEKQGHIGPKKLIIAACQSPRGNRKRHQVANVSHDALINKLLEFNYTSREVLECDELMQFLIPIIRADFSINESYQYVEAKLLNCPIFVYGGQEDTITLQHELKGWALETAKTFHLRLFAGGHFFINNGSFEFFDTLSRDLLEQL